MSAEDKDVRAFLEKLVEVSAKTAGGALGAVVGIKLGNALYGAAIAPFVAQRLDEAGRALINRQFGQRQEIRLGRAIALAAQRMQERIDDGEKPRIDDFFTTGVDDRSAASETAEAALVAAMASFEERKIPYIARLLANICFEPKVDRASANLLIDLSTRLSYRSLILLNLFRNTDALGLAKRRQTGPAASLAVSALLVEIVTLEQLGLVEMKMNSSDADAYAVLAASDVEPAHMRTVDLGLVLCELLELDNLDPTDNNAVVETIRLLNSATLTSGSAHNIDAGTF